MKNSVPNSSDLVLNFKKVVGFYILKNKIVKFSTEEQSPFIPGIGIITYFLNDNYGKTYSSADAVHHFLQPG